MRRTGDKALEADMLQSLGNAYQRAGDYVEARKLAQASLAIDVALYCPAGTGVEQACDDLRVMKGINTLAGVDYHEGQYASARVRFEQILRAREKRLGPNHPDVAVALNNLAATLTALGDYRGALEMLRRCLALRESLLGVDHPEVAGTLLNMGNAAENLGDLDFALTCQRRALAIHQKQLGREHVKVAAARFSMATLSRKMQRVDEALELYTAALTTFEAKLGPAHPAVATVLNSRGNAHFDRGDLQSTTTDFQRARAIWEDADSGDADIAVTNIARVVAERGDHRRAEGLYRRALASREKRLGPEHPRLAVPLLGLGEALIDLSRYGDAVVVLQRALGVQETAARPTEAVARTRHALARTLWQLHASGSPERERAIEFAEKARDDYAALQGHDKERAAVESWLARPGERR